MVCGVERGTARVLFVLSFTIYWVCVASELPLFSFRFLFSLLSFFLSFFLSSASFSLRDADTKRRRASAPRYGYNEAASRTLLHGILAARAVFRFESLDGNARNWMSPSLEGASSALVSVFRAINLDNGYIPLIGEVRLVAPKQIDKRSLITIKKKRKKSDEIPTNWNSYRTVKEQKHTVAKVRMEEESSRNKSSCAVNQRSLVS